MKKRISEKNVSGFVNILFLVFQKGDKQKICARFFKICKYTFLIFEKGDKQKNCARFFKNVSGFVNMLF